MSSNLDPKPKYDFRTCLKKSEVLKPDVFEKWLSENPDPSDIEDAAGLVKQKLLTEWQAKYLLSGRYRLHLGNYQLLTRVRRDSFGDRFVALHPQLGRTVQLQVLPVELTDESDRRERFLNKARRAGELGHPNLAHVFDIDMHQGRYYLVTEYSPSMSLAELDAPSLSAVKIATIIRDSIAGLKHAHERSVVHEYLSMDNVLITEQDVVKISQIALSPLTKQSTQMAKENVSPEQGDLLAVVRMGRRLLNHLPSSTTTRQLTKLVSNLNTKDEKVFTESLAELESWIEQSTVESPSQQPVENYQADTKDPVAVTDGEIERLKNNAQLTETQKAKSRRRTSQAWEAGPGSSNVGRFSSLAAVTITVGLLAYFGLQAIRKSAPSRPSSQNQTALQDRNDSTIRHRSLIGPKTMGLLDPSDLVTNQAGPSPNGTPVVPATQPLLPPPVVNPNAFGPKPDESESSPKAAAETSKSTVPAAGQQAKRTEGTDKPPSTSTKSDSVPMAKTPSKNPSTKTSAKSKTQKNNAQKPKNAEPPEPFDGFPKFVDLPTTESTDEVILGTLKQSSIHLLAMELKTAAGIGKGKTDFSLERNETTKRQWTLLAKKTPRNKGDAVGQFDFDKPSGQIKFHWLPEAASSRIANYVRNCALKMKLANTSRTLALRSPVILSDLKLTRDKPSAKVESAIEWIPDPKQLTVELLPIKKSGFPEIVIESPIVQPGTPSIIHFHKAAGNRFMWLQLDTSIRKKANFDLRLMLKHADGTVQPIARSNDLKKLVTLLRAAAADAQQEYDANKDITPPKGKVTKFKEFVAKLKSNAKKTLKQSEIARENIQIVESFYDRGIPMRLMFRTDDYQIVLLESIASSP